MNNEVNAYRSKIKANLQCFHSKKEKLVQLFDKLLLAYLEDNPSPSTEQLNDAFGTPEDMAKTLMSEIPIVERTRYERSRRYILSVAVTLSVAIIVFLSIWLFTSLQTEEVYATGIVYISEPVYYEGELYEVEEESEHQKEANDMTSQEIFLP